MRKFGKQKGWRHSGFVVVLGCLTLNSLGCGGDAYEKKFDDSMKHIKDTGYPLGHVDPAPSPDATQPAGDSAAGGNAGGTNAAPQN